MNKAAVLLLLVAGCSNGCAADKPSPHDLVACEQTTWPINGQTIQVATCARACTVEPTWENVSCVFQREDGAVVTETMSFVTPEHIRGFCGFVTPIDFSAPEIGFYECTAGSVPPAGNEIPH